jgi:hypothetical protein
MQALADHKHVLGRSRSRRPCLSHREALRLIESPLKQLALEGWRDVRKDHDQAGVQFTLSHQPTEIACVVGNEYEFFAQNHLSELMILEPRPSSPCHMMGLLAGLVCDIRETGMQAFIDQKSHLRVSLREISRQGVCCHGWRGGRPLRGYACAKIFASSRCSRLSDG